MPTYSQAGRMLQVHTPLGTDVLLLEQFSGQEGVSTLFSYTLDMVSTSATIDPSKILGQPIQVAMLQPDGTTRVTCGVVRRFSQLGVQSGLLSCTLEMVPATWVLTRTTNWCVFQNLTTQDIVLKVLQSAGITNFRFALTSSYSPREYCVQYGESDMDFISRLLEDEGMFYFFEHGAQGDVFVVGDGPAAVKPMPGLAGLTYTSGVDNIVTSLYRQDAVATGKVTVRDYDFTKPLTTLSSTVSGSAAGQWEVGEDFDYPGGFSQITDGDRRAGIRMEAIGAGLETIVCVTNSRSLRTGYAIDIKGPLAGMKGPFLLLQLSLAASIKGTYSSAATVPLTYTSSFTAIAQAVTYRPPRATQRPIARGPQSAVVTGPAGQEIYTDQYGRVKIQFHWDRVGKLDDLSSCWVRVATPLAGKAWGAVQIPRIGQEVIVAFLDGDPDRPLITGLVYNADQTVPYPLPANKTQLGIKTHSTPAGTGSNEFRFEDKNGGEEVWLHAQRDLNAVVENNESHKVLGARTSTITGDDTLTLSKGSHSVEVSQGNQAVDVAQGTQTVTVNGLRQTTIKTGNDQLDVKAGNVTTNVSMGNVSTTASMGSINLSAMQQIILQVGGSSIKIDQTGITISGLCVDVNGQVQTQISGLTTQVNGSAMVQVKGAITLINS